MRGERRARVLTLEPVSAEIALIPLTRGMVAIVDAADFEKLSRYRWFTLKTKRGPCYAGTNMSGRIISMHRFLMNPPKGMWVDHIDGNGLNNRRSNLRICTPRQNACNHSRRKPKSATSQFVGVFQRRQQPDKWYAKVEYAGMICRLGPFDSELEAARARDFRAVELHGPYAHVNLPDEWPPERRAAVMEAAQTRCNAVM
jgi:hypothetical protein